MMNNKIIDYFYKDLQKYLPKNSIIKNYYFFSEDFIPQDIKFREEQKEKIIKNIFMFLKGIRNINSFLFGNTGTGKTLLSRYISSAFRFYSAKEKIKLKAIYINCRLIDSKEKDYYIYGKIYEELYNIKFKSGYRKNEIYELIKEKIVSENYKIILILDEVDFLFKDKSDLLYNFLRSDDSNITDYIYNIFISNSITFLEDIDPRIKSSLSSVQFIEFPPYEMRELKEILLDRVKIALNENTISEDIINYIVARVIKEYHSDARIAINILKNSALIAEEKEKDRIELEDVKEAFENYDIDILDTTISALNKTEKILLYSLIKKQIEKEDYISFSEIYEEYENISSKLGYSLLDRNTVYKYMRGLEMILGNYLEASNVSNGKNGYKRIYKLIIDSDKIKKIIDKLKNNI